MVKIGQKLVNVVFECPHMLISHLIFICNVLYSLFLKMMVDVATIRFFGRLNNIVSGVCRNFTSSPTHNLHGSNNVKAPLPILRSVTEAE